MSSLVIHPARGIILEYQTLSHARATEKERRVTLELCSMTEVESKDSMARHCQGLIYQSGRGGLITWNPLSFFFGRLNVSIVLTAHSRKVL